MFDDAGEHGDCSTIADRDGKSKTYHKLQDAKCEVGGVQEAFADPTII